MCQLCQKYETEDCLCQWCEEELNEYSPVDWEGHEVDRQICFGKEM